MKTLELSYFVVLIEFVFTPVPVFLILPFFLLK